MTTTGDQLQKSIVKIFLMGEDILISQGKTIVEAIKILGVSDVIYYLLRKEHGNTISNQIGQLKELEKEIVRLH